MNESKRTGFVIKYRFRGKGASRRCEYQKMLIRTIELWANDNVRAHGFLTVCDVLKQLDHPIAVQDLLYGWTKDGDPVKFTFLHDGKYSLTFRMNPTVLIDTI